MNERAKEIVARAYLYASYKRFRRAPRHEKPETLAKYFGALRMFCLIFDKSAGDIEYAMAQEYAGIDIPEAELPQDPTGVDSWERYEGVSE